MDQRICTWLRDSLGAAVIEEVRSLTFGISSELTLLSVDGRSVVLRVYRDDHVLREMPGVVSHEIAALRAARSVLGDVVPAPLAGDPDGTVAGRPALAMTFVSGATRIHDTDPERLVGPLARLHAQPPPDELGRHDLWFDPTNLASPSWSEATSVWASVIEIVRNTAPAHDEPVFLHRDYHPGNLLWEGEQLSGIVDWAFSCAGPRGLDVAHMRANLALVDGIEAADRFLEAYQREVPSYVHDRWWDMAELMTWDEEFRGVLAFNAWLSEPLTLAGVQARCDAWARHLIGGVAAAQA